MVLLVSEALVEQIAREVLVVAMTARRPSAMAMVVRLASVLVAARRVLEVKEATLVSFPVKAKVAFMDLEIRLRIKK